MNQVNELPQVIIVLIGVAGAGKTTVGRMLAQDLGWPFYEGDEFHPQPNVEKMQAGIPLTDEDRKLWLERLSELIAGLTRAGQSAVLTCSALKAQYRRRLRDASVIEGAVRLVYLRVSPEEAGLRIQRRVGHFMPASLIASQFAALEEPTSALTVDGTVSPREASDQVRRTFGV